MSRMSVSAVQWEKSGIKSGTSVGIGPSFGSSSLSLSLSLSCSLSQTLCCCYFKPHSQQPFPKLFFSDISEMFE